MTTLKAMERHMDDEAGTIGVHEPQWTGFTQEEREEYEELATRLKELRTQANARARRVDGLEPHHVHRCHKVVALMRRLDLGPDDLDRLYRERLEYELHSALGGIYYEGDVEGRMLAYTRTRLDEQDAPTPSSGAGE